MKFTIEIFADECRDALVLLSGVREELKAGRLASGVVVSSCAGDYRVVIEDDGEWPEPPYKPGDLVVNEGGDTVGVVEHSGPFMTGVVWPSGKKIVKNEALRSSPAPPAAPTKERP